MRVWRSRQRQGPGELTGLSLGLDGFALAHVSSGVAGCPRLDACEYRELGAGRDPAPEIARLVAEMSLGGSACSYVLHPSRYSLRQIETPAVEPEELRDAARWAIKDLVDFDVVDAAIDAFEVPSVGEFRSKHTYVAAADPFEIRMAVEVVRESGLTIEAIDICELALRNIISLRPEDEQGAVTLFLQDDIGIVVVTRQQTLYLARNVDADPVLIETIAACDPDAKSESEEAMALMDSYLLEIQRSLDYCEHQLGLPPIGDVIVAPTNPPSPALPLHLEQGSSARVSTLDLSTVFELPSPIDATQQARCLAAVGAALRQRSQA